MWLSVTILDQPTRGANFKAKNLSAWVVFWSNQSLGSNMKIIGVIWPVCPIFMVDQVDRFYRCSHGITSTWPLAPHFPRGVACPSFSAMPGRLNCLNGGSYCIAEILMLHPTRHRLPTLRGRAKSQSLDRCGPRNVFCHRARCSSSHRCLHILEASRGVGQRCGLVQ